METYRQYFEEMPCYLSVHDQELRIVDGNRKFREDFGDRIGERCYKVYKHRDDICPECPVALTFQDGKSHASEQLLVTQHGRPVQVMVHTTPIRNSKGELVVMEQHTEINEVKRLQNLLAESQARYARLFEEVPCFITVQDRELVIQHANRRFRETFGPAVGRRCYEVYKHREEPCLVCPALETMGDGRAREHEEVLTSGAGAKLNVYCTTTPLLGPDGKVEAVIEMSTDITQLRELQSQLTSIGLLVGSISHSIKGLLTGLDGGIYLVSSGFSKNQPERVQKGWQMVLRNVDRIRSMVMDILYYAKDRELQLEEVSPAALIGELQADLHKKATDIDVALELVVAPDAGSVPADTMAVRAMLLNLIENSLDACRADSAKGEHRVRLAVRREPPFMLFDLEDNGVGMDRETKEKAFSLFFSSKGIKGTGLGLFISNKIVDKHGGRIEVDSEPGRGTRFRVYLPLEARPSVPVAVVA
jgi:PAS domain S-box-containing protein